MNKTELPPLPEPRDMDGARWGYDADDLHNYGVDAWAAGVAAERKRWIAICRDHAADKEPPHKEYEGYADGWLDACNEVMWAGEGPNAQAQPLAEGKSAAAKC